MDSAFLFQHYSNYNVNAGQNLSNRVIRANTARENVRNNTPSLQDFEGSSDMELSKVLSQIPSSFSYLDILEGVRGNKGSKGPVERASEELLKSSAAGDCFKVRSLIESGKVHVDVADKTGYTALLAAAVSISYEVVFTFLYRFCCMAASYLGVVGWDLYIDAIARVILTKNVKFFYHYFFHLFSLFFFTNFSAYFVLSLPILFSH